MHMNLNEKLSDAERRAAVLAILQVVRVTFEQVKHHKVYGKRVIDAFRKALPDYSVYGGFEHSLGKFRVWGKSLPYNDSLYFCWNSGRTWQEGFEQEILRQDPSDAIERARDESAIEAECVDMERQILALQARAKLLVASLPIPKSAVTRKDSIFWESPSRALAEKCPNLFGGH